MSDEEQESLTFEEFQRHVKESEEPCCGICFSFGRYKHLNEDMMRLAYTDFIADFEAHQTLVVEYLAKYKDQPLDDQIYFLICNCEFFRSDSPDILKQVLELVLARAHEAVGAKRRNAWVLVRAYGWIEGFDPAKLVEFLDKTQNWSNDEGLTIWQVVMQCLGSWALPAKLGKDHPSLSVARDKVVQYMDQVAVMKDDIRPAVVYSNGLHAMAALQDSRVVDYAKNHPKPHLLNGFLGDFIARHIKFLTEQNDPFLSVMEELKNVVDHATQSRNAAQRSASGPSSSS